ncbi:MAG: hypothetical protein II828_08900 [Clostridia bacterium]|nr:hypothetical protein [Clostridia bacterium]
MTINAQEAWEKFIETGRVDYYLLSRGINIYAEGVLPSEQRQALLRLRDAQTAPPFGGDGIAPDGFGHHTEGSAIG